MKVRPIHVAAAALGGAALGAVARWLLSNVPLEPFAKWEPPRCDPSLVPIGTVALRSYVVGKWGGSDLGIWRPCSQGKPSHHHEGRAWDWQPPAEGPWLAFDWLLEPDAAGNACAWARRLGLSMIIHNGRWWRAHAGHEWQDYPGPDKHEDHVHISLSRAGARGETSGYAMLPAAG